MALQKLPIGIQTFKTIIDEDYLYIDKTKEAYELIDNYKYTFLSRPRRFGKSLFLDTLQNIFQGKKELFKGLYIYDKWNWDIKYPVIFLIMNDEFLMLNDLKRDIANQLQNIAQKHSIKLENEEPSCMLSTLLRDLHQKYSKRVVLLVDDADKPFRNRLDHPDLKEIHNFLLGFYITTKGCDEDIKFSMITGIYPIKGDYFFGFNNFTDISLNKKYGDVCGFTQKELEENLSEHLKLNINHSKLKEWYNGYNFLKSDVYNPFDLLQFIKNDYLFDNYWFITGTPTFLIKLIEKNNYFLPTLLDLTIGKEILNSFDIENLDLEVILYQSGYLTIDKMIIDEDDDIIYKLKLPNLEVKKSFNTFIINTFYKDNSLQNKNISKALRDKNLDGLKNAFIQIFASIPYNNYTKSKLNQYEGFYATVVYVYLQSLGLNIIGEDVTNKGRIDLTIKFQDSIYIIEFKVGGDDALGQIKQKKYYEKYLDYKEIYLVGINFDEKDKNISNFEWEKLENK